MNSSNNTEEPVGILESVTNFFGFGNESKKNEKPVLPTLNVEETTVSNAVPVTSPTVGGRRKRMVCRKTRKGMKKNTRNTRKSQRKH